MTNHREANAVPGLGTDRSAAYRTIIVRSEDFLPGFHVIDGSKARDTGNSPITELRAGLILGKITASNKLAPSIIAVMADAYDDSSSGGTKVQVTAAEATEIVRRLGETPTLTFVGPPTASGTVNSESKLVSSINTTTGVITLDSALAQDYIAGTFIQASDGSETPLTFLFNGYPIAVTDEDGNNLDVEMGKYPVGGIVDSSQLVYWPSNTVLQNWLIGQLNGAGVGQFVFDNKHGK